jgi:hypothetical protein
MYLVRVNPWARGPAAETLTPTSPSPLSVKTRPRTSDTWLPRNIREKQLFILYCRGWISIGLMVNPDQDVSRKVFCFQIKVKWTQNFNFYFFYFNSQIFRVKRKIQNFLEKNHIFGPAGASMVQRRSESLWERAKKFLDPDPSNYHILIRISVVQRGSILIWIWIQALMYRIPGVELLGIRIALHGAGLNQKPVSIEKRGKNGVRRHV